jgi:hypothetical protein
MSIRCVCPNGHVLNVKETQGGTCGLCPTCKATVQVPQLCDKKLSEDAIMDILGPRDAASKPQAAAPKGRPAAPERRAPVDAPQSGTAMRTTTIIKNCNHCHQEISAGMHICPYCHTYIAKIGDF